MKLSHVNVVSDKYTNQKAVEIWFQFTTLKVTIRRIVSACVLTAFRRFSLCVLKITVFFFSRARVFFFYFGAYINMNKKNYTHTKLDSTRSKELIIHYPKWEKNQFYLFFIQLRFFWYVRHDRPCDWFWCNKQIFIININAHEYCNEYTVIVMRSNVIMNALTRCKAHSRSAFCFSSAAAAAAMVCFRFNDVCFFFSLWF